VQLSLFGTMAPHHGRATVQVDDGPVRTIDQYAATRREDVLVYESGPLEAGDHTAVVRVLGQHHEDSSGVVIAIDRAEVVERTPDGGSGPDTTTAINDAGADWDLASITYDGEWSTAQGGPHKHEGDDHYSSTRGSTYTVRFTGTALALHGALAPHHGRSTVQIDDGPVTTVDQYAAVREDDVLVYQSEMLPDAEHVAVVTVLGERHRSSSGDVVTVDRATVTHAPATPVSTPHGIVWRDTGEGQDLRPYASTSLNDEHPLWHVESASGPVSRVDGKLTKVSTAQFHRMFSTRRFGGPGKTVKISYRARATAIRDRAGSRIVEGVKVGMRFPNPRSKHAETDPRSAYGTGGKPTSPGSYQFLTGLTEGGYIELARNGYGPDGYEFFPSKKVGYRTGTWKDVVVLVEWLDDAIRVRYWHNADGAGAPVYDVTDEGSPFVGSSGFLWMRSDDTDWEYEDIEVEECQGRCRTS